MLVKHSLGIGLSLLVALLIYEGVRAQTSQDQPIFAGAISYSLVASVANKYGTVAAENTTLPECGRICGDSKKIVCIGFSWLPTVPLPETALARSTTGQCRLLVCVPDGTVEKGPARLYLRVRNSMTPQYGVFWKVPDGYTKLCTFAYAVYRTKMNFTGADEACRADGGRLLFTRTPQQHLEVNSNITRSITYWIGMADVAGNRIFRWLDGSDIGPRTEWGQDQPNNYRADTKEPQSCVILHNGVWNDEQCSKLHSYLCQILYVDI
ncbi:collectin-12 [Hyalella azteca]|uniref:Collectin-12 n=1 Tax=Hyalella azteca TaxID=294128 RepID=A0A8B7N2P2_HYAAZ|nr:collectin-12 [Hyalella azteca]